MCVCVCAMHCMKGLVVGGSSICAEAVTHSVKMKAAFSCNTVEVNFVHTGA